MLRDPSIHDKADYSLLHTHSPSRSDQGISNLDPYHSVVEVLEGYTAQVLYNPVRPRFLDLLDRVGRSQTNDLEASSFARTDSRGSILKDDHVRVTWQAQSFAAEQIAVRVWFSLFNVFGHHDAAWVCQFEDLNPSVQKCPCSRSTHCPGRIDALEIGEQFARPRDFDRVLPELLGY